MDMRIDEKGKYFTPRVAKDTLPAFIRTADQIIVGHVYVRPEKRLKDDLNEDASRFLPVTDARVYNAADETLLRFDRLECRTPKVTGASSSSGRSCTPRSTSSRRRTSPSSSLSCG